MRNEDHVRQVRRMYDGELERKICELGRWIRERQVGMGASEMVLCAREMDLEARQMNVGAIVMDLGARRRRD